MLVDSLFVLPHSVYQLLKQLTTALRKLYTNISKKKMSTLNSTIKVSIVLLCRLVISRLVV